MTGCSKVYLNHAVSETAKLEYSNQAIIIKTKFTFQLSDWIYVIFLSRIRGFLDGSSNSVSQSFRHVARIFRHNVAV
jgi:hypothetical protein